MLAVTHRPEGVRVSDRVLVLDHGRLVHVRPGGDDFARELEDCGETLGGTGTKMA